MAIENVNLQHQEALMQLMARENISVKIMDTNTAYFSPKEREVILPSSLFFLSKDIADLFSCHEIAHALYTPVEFTEMISKASGGLSGQQKKFFLYAIQVFEDERIERKIKQEFKGLNGIFYRAYADLHQTHNFFRVSSFSQKELDSDHILNRANFFYKAGHVISINFSEKEFIFIENASANKSFADVIEFCINFTKEFDNTKQETTKLIDKKELSGAEDIDDGTPFEIETDLDEPPCELINDESEIDESEIDESELEDLFKSPGLKDLLDDVRSFVVNVKLPDPSLAPHFVVDYVTLTKERLKKAKRNADKIKREIRQNARIMSNEFEAKKSAARFAKMKIGTTGDLNPSRLSQYKTDDALFKTREIIKDDKNHGIILFVDYSSSMAPKMKAVKIQMLQISEFCRLSQIPFEIYAFSNSGRTKDYIRDKNRKNAIIREAMRNQFNFGFLHLLSSRRNRKEYTDAFESISQTLTFRPRYYYEYDYFETLGTTPLRATKYMSVGIVDDFKKKNPSVQNVKVLFITDGAASDRTLNTGEWTKSIIECGDKKVSFQMKKQPEYRQYGYKNDISDYFLYEFFKKNHPNVEFSNLFLSSNFYLSLFPKGLCRARYQSLEKQFASEGFIKWEYNDALDSEYIIDSTALSGTSGVRFKDKLNFEEEGEEGDDDGDSEFKNLEESFQTHLVYRKKRNTISRKIAEFLS